MRYAITNDVIKYVVQNNSIWFTIAHGITNMQSKLMSLPMMWSKMQLRVMLSNMESQMVKLNIQLPRILLDIRSQMLWSNTQSQKNQFELQSLRI